MAKAQKEKGAGKLASSPAASTPSETPPGHIGNLMTQCPTKKPPMRYTGTMRLNVVGGEVVVGKPKGYRAIGGNHDD